jgi:hypothetical protein
MHAGTREYLEDVINCPYKSKMAETKINTSPGTLGKITVIALVIGWVVSLGFTLHAGHHHRPVFLVILFLGWVSSPYLGLLAAGILSKRWPILTRQILYFLMIVLVTGSLVGYSGVFNPAGMKPAFIFLIVPLISWILIAIVIPVSLSRTRKK